MLDLREKIIEVMESSCDCNFENYGEKLLLIQTINFIFDKFDLDTFYDQVHVSKKDYKKYFKKTIKDYNPSMNKEAKKYYKEIKHES